MRLDPLCIGWIHDWKHRQIIIIIVNRGWLLSTIWLQYVASGTAKSAVWLPCIMYSGIPFLELFISQMSWFLEPIFVPLGFTSPWFLELPDFLNVPNSQTNFNFPWRSKKTVIVYCNFPIELFAVVVNLLLAGNYIVTISGWTIGIAESRALFSRGKGVAKSREFWIIRTKCF